MAISTLGKHQRRPDLVAERDFAVPERQCRAAYRLAGAGAPFSPRSAEIPLPAYTAVTVDQMAAAQVSASQGYASDTRTVGTGTITITVDGNRSEHQPSTPSNDTLDGVAESDHAPRELELRRRW